MKELDEKEKQIICIRKEVVKHSYQDTSHFTDLSGFKFRQHVKWTTAHLYIVLWKGNNEKLDDQLEVMISKMKNLTENRIITWHLFLSM